MRVLLDECLPRRLKQHVSGHDVATVQEMGWAGIKNGELLSLAARAFDAFVTVDQGLTYQQRTGPQRGGFELGVVLLVARSNRLADLLPLVARLQDALAALQPGDVARVVSTPASDASSH